MKVELDSDVQAVLELMQANVEARKLCGVATAIASRNGVIRKRDSIMELSPDIGPLVKEVTVTASEN